MPLRHLDGAMPLRHLDGAMPLRHLDGAMRLRHLDGAMPLRHLDGAMRLRCLDGGTQLLGLSQVGVAWLAAAWRALKLLGRGPWRHQEEQPSQVHSTQLNLLGGSSWGVHQAVGLWTYHLSHSPFE